MHRQRTACAPPQSLTVGSSVVYLIGEEVAANVIGSSCDDDDDPVAALDGIRNNRAIGSVLLLGGTKSAALRLTFCGLT